AKARVPAQQNAPHHGAPIAGSPTAHGPDGGTMPAPMPPQQPAPPQAAPEPTQDAPQLLPWPTFADGTPLPAGPDGQPDFSVLHQPPQAPAPGQEQHGQPGQQY